MNNLTTTEKRRLRRLMRMVERLKSTDDRMTVSAVLALLHAAVEPEPVVQLTIEHKLGLTTATASRSVAYWKKFRTRDKPGQHMLDSYPDPDNQQYRRVELLPKGHRFLRDLLEDLGYDQEASREAQPPEEA